MGGESSKPVSSAKPRKLSTATFVEAAPPENELDLDSDAFISSQRQYGSDQLNIATQAVESASYSAKAYDTQALENKIATRIAGQRKQMMQQYSDLINTVQNDMSTQRKEGHVLLSKKVKDAMSAEQSVRNNPELKIYITQLNTLRKEMQTILTWMSGSGNAAIMAGESNKKIIEQITAMRTQANNDANDPRNGKTIGDPSMNYSKLLLWVQKQIAAYQPVVQKMRGLLARYGKPMEQTVVQRLQRTEKLCGDAIAELEKKLAKLDKAARLSNATFPATSGAVVCARRIVS